MFLFIISALLSVGINIFLLLKVNKCRKILNINGFIILAVIGSISTLIAYFTFTMSEITNELHLPMSLFFNFLANTFIFYLLLGNNESVKFMKCRLRIIQQTSALNSILSSCNVIFKTSSFTNSIDIHEDNIVMQNSTQPDADILNTLPCDDNYVNEHVISIYVVPL